MHLEKKIPLFYVLLFQGAIRAILINLPMVRYWWIEIFVLLFKLQTELKFYLLNFEQPGIQLKYSQFSGPQDAFMTYVETEDLTSGLYHSKKHQNYNKAGP